MVSRWVSGRSQEDDPTDDPAIEVSSFFLSDDKKIRSLQLAEDDVSATDTHAYEGREIAQRRTYTLYDSLTKEDGLGYIGGWREEGPQDQRQYGRRRKGQASTGQSRVLENKVFCVGEKSVDQSLNGD